MPRNKFDAQLSQLNVEMIKLGALCEDAIKYAIEALLKGDAYAIEMAIEKGDEIDKVERSVEALCMKLFMQQQPVAKDLRFISSALKMISDMERIGDQAQDIANISKFVEFGDIVCELHLKEMADVAVKMVTQSVDSFVKADLQMASDVIKQDDVMDALFDKTKTELIELIASGSDKAECCMDLLMIAKYFERIGDHATNIAEWVEYSITGRHVDEQIDEALAEMG